MQVSTTIHDRAGRLALACLLAVLAGCQHLAERDSSTAEAEQSADQGLLDEVEPQPTLELAIRRLQDGDVQAARSILDRLSDRQPGSKVIPALLRQIELPVSELLPGPYREIEVEQGESLSLIAQRELGDALLFHALARLNGIEVPRRIAAGTRIRVPDRVAIAKDLDSSVGTTRGDANELIIVAEFLAAGGQSEAARDLLKAAIGKDVDRREPELDELLVRLTLERAAAFRVQGRIDEALLMVKETTRVIGEGRSANAPLVRETRRLQAYSLYRQALSYRDDGDQAAALVSVRQALVLEPALESARRLESELGQALIDELHVTALRAWRDRDVDLAIRNWQMLRAAVPDFKPAEIYLQRALELRRRLVHPDDPARASDPGN